MLTVVLSVTALGVVLFLMLILYGIKKQNVFVRTLREREPELWRSLGAPREVYRPEHVDTSGKMKRLMAPEYELCTVNSEVLKKYAEAKRVGIYAAILFVMIILMWLLYAIMTMVRPEPAVGPRAEISGLSQGSTVGALFSAFGHTSPVLVEPQASETSVKEYQYPHARARVTDGEITYLAVWGPEFMTSTGIRPGQTVQRVLTIHGQPELVGDGKYRYVVGDCVYAFSHSAGTVTQIELSCPPSRRGFP